MSDIKKSLLNTLKALPIPKKDKETFIDIIIDNSNNGGNSKFKYLYFKNSVINNNYPILNVLFYFFNAGLMNPIVKIGIILNSMTVLSQGGNFEKNTVDYIRIDNFIIGNNSVVDFYEFMEFGIQQGMPFDKSIINVFKENEVSEEEFIKGIKFGIF